MAPPGRAGSTGAGFARAGGVPAKLVVVGRVGVLGRGIALGRTDPDSSTARHRHRPSARRRLRPIACRGLPGWLPASLPGVWVVGLVRGSHFRPLDYAREPGPVKGAYGVRCADRFATLDRTGLPLKSGGGPKMGEIRKYALDRYHSHAHADLLLHRNADETTTSLAPAIAPLQVAESAPHARWGDPQAASERYGGRVCFPRPSGDRSMERWPESRGVVPSRARGGDLVLTGLPRIIKRLEMGVRSDRDSVPGAIPTSSSLFGASACPRPDPARPAPCDSPERPLDQGGRLCRGPPLGGLVRCAAFSLA